MSRGFSLAAVVLVAASALTSIPRAARAQTSPAEPTPAPSPHSSADWVDLALLTDAPGVGLYAREPRKAVVGDEAFDTWALVCTAPCNERVDPRRTYRVMGDHIRPSIDFNLAPGAGHVALRVLPAERRPHTPGVALGATGAVSGFAGVLLLLLDVAEHEAANAVGSGSASARDELQGRANTFGDVGVGFLAAGAVLGVSALFLLHTGTTELVPVRDATDSAFASRSPLRFVPGGFAF